MKIKLDLEFKYLLKKKWFISHGYPTILVDNKPIYFHKIILPSKDGFVNDHINGNKLDNRRINLRYVTLSQNSKNRKVSKNNTVGFKGVDKQKSGWRARIAVDKKRIHLGLFKTLEEAAKQYEYAASYYYQNFKRNVI